MESLVLLIVMVGGYMLPTIVGAARQHHNTLAITVLNLLLGWTLIGWVVALVWAMTRQPGSVSSPSGEERQPRSIEESSAHLSRARVWIAVIAVLAILLLWGYQSQETGPPDGPTEQTE
ncbi:superinfection immunity protein [Aidingimonas halophila]|uniref:Superinfection immunity protein n=1 Tax=Aidingimonas halophila TaxID=574349 RepID=A0A1H2RDW5_9GAMM|nr:superinfection immunity protein [Aidingimonas halophila]GHC19502.1 hypothetical protein GCM10008094_06930 [Aidingimonas halophila]SDW16859.1 Superinfection immunity protein [Aidingimonas halophila]